MRLHWTGAATVPRPAAPWVTELRAADEAVYRAERERAMREPTTAGDIAFMRGIGLALVTMLIGGLAAPAWAYRKWSGGWRAAAAVPLLLMGFAIVRLLIDTAIDPTSHNLWPLELGMFAIGALVITGVLAIGRRVTSTGRR